MGAVHLTLSMSLDGYVAGPGADVPQQAIRAGLLDEIPVPLGGGKRLFELFGSAPIELERTKVVAAPEGVAHLRFGARR